MVESGFTEAEFESIRAHLSRRYAGVFTDEALRGHLCNHVGFPVAEWAVGTLATCRRWGPGTRILDVGAGFGSFVVRARQQGWDAVGLEIEAAEIEYGRKRIGRLLKDLAPESLLVQGDGLSLPFAAGQFEVVTLWNVLEHVADVQSLIAEVRRILAASGTVYITCPNYAADRLEAHYHLPMEGQVPRDEMIRRLRDAGRDPKFFETSIFYRTNEEVISALRAQGFRLFDITNRQRMDLVPATLWARIRDPHLFRDFHDPKRESIMLAARTP